MTRPGELRVHLSKDAASEPKAQEDARPDVARRVVGDFELTVRVTHTPPAVRSLAAIGRDEPIASAGIALYKPEAERGSFVLLNRLSRNDETWDSYFKMRALYHSKDARGVVGDHSSHDKFAEKPIYLRLTRRGDEFTATKSEDGKEWSAIFKTPFVVPGLGAVVVGPVVAHNTTGSFEVTFDKYSLTKPPEE